MVDFIYVIVLVITSTNTTAVRVLDGNGKSTSLLPSNKVARRPKPQFLRQSSPSTEKTRPLAAAGDGTGIVLTIIPGRQRLSAESRLGHDNVQAMHIKIFTTEMYPKNVSGDQARLRNILFVPGSSGTRWGIICNDPI